MPIYLYKASDVKHSCDRCREGFEQIRKLSDPPLAACSACGAPVKKCFSPPTVGRSQSAFDDRAKSAGFHKLKRRDKGAYEKLY